MTERRRTAARHSSRKRVPPEEEAPMIVIDDDSHSDSSLSDNQLARRQLRQRWELASVLNFLHVFEPLIESDLKSSAEEIETALISPNDDLGRIHLALLKSSQETNSKYSSFRYVFRERSSCHDVFIEGILPMKKNLKQDNRWVTAVCKELDSWWSWVAEGENPLKTNHGKEIERYKELDPTTRLMILKALCELRAEQDDILRHITDKLKEGVKVATFRKEKIGGDGNGTTYWYDGDPIVGHRLYREVVMFDSKKKLKETCQPIWSPIYTQWETLATNLEEFRELSENLSSSKLKSEVSVGEKIKKEILPLLEELQKKKDRKLKRKLRQAMLFENVHKYNRIGLRRTCRERKHASYTHEDYDRSIKEAIQMTEHPVGTSDEEDEDDSYKEYIALDSSNEHYDQKDQANSSRKNYENPPRMQKQVPGFRRSARNTSNISQSSTSICQVDPRPHAEMKKRLRQRPTPNLDFTCAIVSDSEIDQSPKRLAQVSETSGEELRQS